MTQRLTALLATLLLACLATSATAETIELKTGKTIEGEVLAFVADEVTIELKSGAKVVLKLEALAPRTIVRIKQRDIADDDADGWMALGDYSRDTGMWSKARGYYKRAAKAEFARSDDVDAQLAALDDLEAAELYKQAAKAFRVQQLSEARRHAKTLIKRFPTSTWRARAEDLAADAQAALDAIAAAKKGGAKPVIKGKVNKPADPGRPADPSELKGQLKVLHGKLAKLEQHGDAITEKALEADGKGSVSGARRAYEEAVKHYQLAVRHLPLVLKHTREPRELALFSEMKKRLIRKIVRGLSNAATVAMRSGNFRSATSFVDLGLAYDPANRELLTLKQEIDSSRINYKATQRFNLKPRVNSGGSTR